MTTEVFAWVPQVLDRAQSSRGTIYFVYAEKQLNRDHPECIGWPVVIDGELREIVGVERHLPNRPIAVGEKIGLLTRPMS